MARNRITRIKARPSRRDSSGRFPTREEILAFVAEFPDHGTRRDIARAFAVKGDDRIKLKSILKEMMAEGVLETRRKRLTRKGVMPHVAMLDIHGRDSDGGLLARPAEWDGEEAPPVIQLRRSLKPHGKGPAPGVGLRVLARIFEEDGEDGPAYSAEVIKVLEKRSDTVLGILREAVGGGYRMEPVDRRQPELVLAPDAIGEAKPGDLIEVQPMGGARRYHQPSGRVAAVVGAIGSERAFSTIALHAHDIPHVFPAEVLAQAEAAGAVPAGPREDWRDLDLITVDPADAKDHDDAVHAQPDNDPSNIGGFILTVAIADVAAYVTSGSPMDREALRRGNSVYFPDRVVPMLPERISNDLCSLRAGEDRPALAARMRITAEGRKIGHSFHRILMRPRAKLAYEQAQAAIDGAPDADTAPLLRSVLEPLWGAYHALRRARQARAPLDLDLPERKILLKADGSVDRVITLTRLDAHRLIEEFMILANVAAAETLEARRQPLIYRIHDSPSLAKQESLRDFLVTIGQSLARGADLTPARFNTILKRVEGTEFEQLVGEVVLRSQSQAEYSIFNIGHFGLHLLRYAHFTSPIRRYADLTVHRALIDALGLGDGASAEEAARLEEIAGLISVSERRAIAAERETVDRLIASHLSDRIGEQFTGVISGVTKSGLFVKLQHFGADSFVPVSSLGRDYYVYDEAAHALIGRTTGKGFRLGDGVEVELVAVQAMAGSMELRMLSDPQPQAGSSRSYHKSRTAGGRGRNATGGRARARRAGHG